jgi:hypothetical protein
MGMSMNAQLRIVKALDLRPYEVIRREIKAMLEIAVSDFAVGRRIAQIRKIGARYKHHHTAKRTLDFVAYLKREREGKD